MTEKLKKKYWAERFCTIWVEDELRIDTFYYNSTQVLLIAPHLHWIHTGEELFYEVKEHILKAIKKIVSIIFPFKDISFIVVLSDCNVFLYKKAKYITI